ncbi:MAG TPA: iron ABC transporter permease [Candidatus Enterocloster excrementipullorum]|uniref:Iron ABC transporter permease n=1 Tax=Candidatus Enterocloster excrementipullorum TaxID=2838559 RepID=A0A9D2SID6_9FIRM|nr:iron ABC transporter permease [Candidatus Enterocloster excrementipullorum]
MGRESITAAYRKRVWKKAVYFAAAACGLLVLAAASCCLGIADVTPGRLLATYVPGAEKLLSATPLNEREKSILLMLRLPRVVSAMAAGAGLGTAGAAMQAITGNQMASPFTTGLSGAAALGAAAVIVFGGVSPFMAKTATVAAAFFMALVCAIAVFGIANFKGMGQEALVLTGIALNYLFSALNSTMQFIANEEQLPAIVHWSFGSLNSVGWSDIAVMGLCLAITFPVFCSQGWAFNLMAAGGDETARALGVNTRRVRLAAGAAITLATAGVVSFTGVIGFVGLAAPHGARLLLGGDYRQVIPFSFLIGAALVLAADTLGRTVFSPVTIPVGIVVSYVGVPLFLFLILKERRGRL